MSLRKATKFDELGLGRFQSQAKLPQSLAQRLLDPDATRPKGRRRVRQKCRRDGLWKSREVEKS